jgi:DNA-binding transcriptional MerR regulator
MSESLWTLDELAERVDAALAVDYHGQPSGRVRDVPDRRAIRWYTTIGLVDRPAGHRGRTAMYGPRHLLQLVAVKRLQARGLPLVAIQQQLAGATDAQLARLARLPATPALAAASGMARRTGFWRERPAATAAAPELAAAEPTTSSEVPGGEADGVATLRGVRLGERATLLLDPGRPLDRADLRAILDAARPLLDTLRARGLDGSPDSPGRTGGSDPGREHP